MKSNKPYGAHIWATGGRGVMVRYLHLIIAEAVGIACICWLTGWAYASIQVRGEILPSDVAFSVCMVALMLITCPARPDRD